MSTGDLERRRRRTFRPTGDIANAKFSRTPSAPPTRSTLKFRRASRATASSRGRARPRPGQMTRNTRNQTECAPIRRARRRVRRASAGAGRPGARRSNQRLGRASLTRFDEERGVERRPGDRLNVAIEPVLDQNSVAELFRLLKPHELLHQTGIDVDLAKGSHLVAVGGES